MLPTASTGLISMSARIYGSRSCVLTENYVACSSMGEQGRPTIKFYSITQEAFGVCLCSVQLRQSTQTWLNDDSYCRNVLFPLYLGHTNVVSLDLSPCGRHMLLGTTSRRDMYHINRVRTTNILAAGCKYCGSP